MQGYCVRCRAKQDMLNATRTYMKNGRRAMIGHCECCGTKMTIAGKWDSDPAEPCSVEGTLEDGARARVEPAKHTDSLPVPAGAAVA
ncbi:MAG: DUF5679 domain-containing protein [Capsulimonadaceae bacterium]